MNDASHQASFGRGWPSLLLTLTIVGAAVYSFSPRSAPPFAPTQIYPERLIINGLARGGERLIAAGEGGVILTADNPAGPWARATVQPNRGSTLTRVLSVDQRLALAVGHDGWIVRSEDGGASWSEAAFEPERSEPLLGVFAAREGALFAFGAFGRFLTSTDQGKTWQPQTLVEAAPEPGATAPKAAPAPPPEPTADDPFGTAGVTEDAGIADRHLNGMTQLADGSLLLVGERGLIANSKDGGQTWTALPEIYPGSFYGALPLADGSVLVYGMRGNAFVSSDLKTWTKSETPNINSLFGGTVTEQGRVILVGASNTMIVSSDGGKTFQPASERDRFALASVLPLADGKVLTGGEGGVAVTAVATTGAKP